MSWFYNNGFAFQIFTAMLLVTRLLSKQEGCCCETGSKQFGREENAPGSEPLISTSNPGMTIHVNHHIFWFFSTRVTGRNLIHGQDVRQFELRGTLFVHILSVNGYPAPGSVGGSREEIWFTDKMYDNLPHRSCAAPFSYTSYPWMWIPRWVMCVCCL